MDSCEAVESVLGKILAARRVSLATAESCSGGLIAHRITNVPGASVYFLGGVVAYSNAIKTALLGVDAEVLAACGAVSEPVARQMSEGVRTRFGADYGIGVTGVAGPGGGTETKPAGLVFIAVARAGETRVDRCQFAGPRAAVKEQTADFALGRLLEWLS